MLDLHESIQDAGNTGLSHNWLIFINYKHTVD